MTYTAKKIQSIANTITVIMFPIAISLPLIGSLFKLELTSCAIINSAIIDRAVETASTQTKPANAGFNNLDFTLVSVGGLCLHSRDFNRPGSGARYQLETNNWENRQLAELPSLEWTTSSIKDFPAKFEAYYNDHFGFRGNLIQWHNFVKVKGLGVSPSENVTIGKKGWLFYVPPQVIDDYRSKDPFAPEELAHWKRILEARRNWLAAKGIHYLFVIAPNKETIYPEFLPDSLKRGNLPTRLDQLVTYLNANSDFVILDLRNTLRKAKMSDRVYHRTDSHWNKPGVFSAYQEIIRTLAVWFPDMRATPISAFERTTIYRPGGDLTKMLGLRDILQEEVLKFSPRVTMGARRVSSGISRPNLPEGKQPFATEVQNSRLPRAVIFHDSFGLNLAPLIAENFQRIVFVNEYEFEPDIIQKERPHVVIQEMVERTLTATLPENPPEVRDFKPARQSGSDSPKR